MSNASKFWLFSFVFLCGFRELHAGMYSTRLVKALRSPRHKAIVLFKPSASLLQDPETYLPDYLRLRHWHPALTLGFYLDLQTSLKAPGFAMWTDSDDFPVVAAHTSIRTSRELLATGAKGIQFQSISGWQDLYFALQNTFYGLNSFSGTDELRFSYHIKRNECTALGIAAENWRAPISESSSAHDVWNLMRMNEVRQSQIFIFFNSITENERKIQEWRPLAAKHGITLAADINSVEEARRAKALGIRMFIINSIYEQSLPQTLEVLRIAESIPKECSQHVAQD